MNKIGCCGFAVAREQYFKTFDVVEIQQTFYQPPGLHTIKQWRDQAPPGFEFTIKAWQLITHEPSSPTYRRLKTSLSDTERRQAGGFRFTDVVRRAWDTTRQVAEALAADKVLFQCPASFTPNNENIDRLRTFFTSIHREGITCLWEPRGQWPADQIRALCRELDLRHCVDPFVSECVTQGLRYYRLHGIGGYGHRYSDQELVHLSGYRRRRGQSYFMFNNISMLQDAKRFQELLSASR